MNLTLAQVPILLQAQSQFALLAVDKILALLKHDIVPQPSVEDYACLLRRCSKEKNRSQTHQLHTLLQNCGLEVHISLGNRLVAVLADVGIMNVAQQVFDKLQIQNEGSWHSLIIGYARFGEPDLALLLFRRMQAGCSFSLSGPVSVALLKACAVLKDFITGSNVHAEIARTGLLDWDIFVGSALIDMYAKCDMLSKVQQVFEKLSIRNVVTWNALMAAYTNHGYGRETLNYFNQMHFEGISPDPVTFVCILKACGNIQDTDKGREIHDEIERQGLLEKDHILGGALVDMYIKGGSLTKAKEVFDKLPVRDVVAWTSLLAGYAQQECEEEVLKYLEQMELEGVSFDATAFVCRLQACAGIGAIDKGIYLHAEIASLGQLHENLTVGNALIDMYTKCGLLSLAQSVFDKLLARDVVSWNSLLSGYVGYGHGEETLKLFEQMRLERVVPNAVTYVASLKACGLMKALEMGQEIHVEVEMKGLDGELLLGNALIDMYAKCGLLIKAQQVFDKLSARTEVSWTSLIAGYAEHGYGKEALTCFERMVQEGVCLDVAAFVCSLKACAVIGAGYKGEEMHEVIKKQPWLQRDLAISNTLIDMYVKCGLLLKAQEFFDSLPARNACLWTTLIAGYTDHGQGEEALNCFEQMTLEGISPDNVAYICCLKACGNVGATSKGRELHAEVARRGLIDRDPAIGSTLVDMYAKCGSITSAQQVFDRLPVQDVASWNSLILGHSQLGDCDSVFSFFYKMLQEGMVPDSVTFIVVLSACKHAGLSHKSCTYLDLMSKDFGLIPTSDHHACIVDALCSTGHLCEAMEIIRRIPCYLDLAIWQTILGACRSLGNVELGKETFKYAVHADREHAAAYIMMSHINAGAVA